jgi:hypothetical protein
MARKPPKGKSLAEVNPKIAKQWHDSKNGDLTASDVSCGSNDKVWWKCDKGDDHEWKASVNNRSKGRGCSVCSNTIVVKSNCLKTLYPKISNLWHPTKNGNLSPQEFVPGSNKKVWWKCPEGDDHEWEQLIIHVVQKTSKYCSICSNDIIVSSNSLAMLYPETSLLWHPKKNGDLTPLEVGPGSHKKVWWKCPNGEDHEWKTSVRNLFDMPSKKATGCPCCAGQKLSSTNCLANVNPEVSKEWDYQKNYPLRPQVLLKRSSAVYSWICSENPKHTWDSSIANRNRPKGGGCPYCAGQKVNETNSLSTTNPELAKEWHPTKNGDFTPDKITEASNKLAWWKCLKEDDHVWKTVISSRLQSGCPSCAEYGFNRSKDSLFYIRKIDLDNRKQALKFGITNNMDGDREKQQKRHVKGGVKTILREEVSGEIALDIENLCKKYFGRKGFLTKEEFPDGFTETIKYSEENLIKIKSIVDEVLTEKAEKKN